MSDFLLDFRDWSRSMTLPARNSSLISLTFPRTQDDYYYSRVRDSKTESVLGFLFKFKRILCNLIPEHIFAVEPKKKTSVHLRHPLMHINIYTHYIYKSINVFWFSCIPCNIRSYCNLTAYFAANVNQM